jgi:hypothetical protein
MRREPAPAWGAGSRADDGVGRRRAQRRQCAAAGAALLCPEAEYFAFVIIVIP